MLRRGAWLLVFAALASSAWAAELANVQVVKQELASLRQKLDKLVERRQTRAGIVDSVAKKMDSLTSAEEVAKSTTVRFMETSGERARADDQRRASSARRAGSTQRAGTTMRSSTTNRASTTRRAGTRERAGATKP